MQILNNKGLEGSPYLTPLVTGIGFERRPFNVTYTALF